MRTIAVGWALLLLLSAGEARADGGRMVYSGKTNGYRISVFVAPTPLRPGPADVSVLVQDAVTGDIVPDAVVWVLVAGGEQQRRRTSRQEATNKLYQATTVTFPTAGHWGVQIDVEGPLDEGACRFEIEVAPPLPRWQELGGWLLWPIFAVALFTLRELCLRNRPVGSQGGRVNRGPRAPSGASQAF